MSTERLSLGFNSLIPETYSAQAEAFAKCLQHKLLSLGGMNASSDSYSGGSRKRLSSDNQSQEEEVNFLPCTAQYPKSKGTYSERTKPNKRESGRNYELSLERKTNVAFVDRTDDSEEEFYSHSESDTSDVSDQKKQTEPKPAKGAESTLVTMSSEDSTVDSWCSCQDSLDDLEKFDSDTEEINPFLIQGSPKPRNCNSSWSKRKEIKEKAWKKKSNRNRFSLEDVNPEEAKCSEDQFDSFDSESNVQHIIFDDSEVGQTSHLTLKEPSSTSNTVKCLSAPCQEEAHKIDVDPNTTLKPLEKSDKKSWKADEKAFPSNLEENLALICDAVRNKILPPASEEDDGHASSTENELENRLNSVLLKSSKRGELNKEVENLETFSAKDAPDTENKEAPFELLISENSKNEGEITKYLDCDSNDSEFVNATVEVLANVTKEVKPDTESNAEKSEVDENYKPIIIVESDKASNRQTAQDHQTLNSESKLQRSSSLKTWKTPPGTPGAKKIVRFADALGLDLADVRTFLDEIPKVPSSAYDDLHFDFPSNTEPVVVEAPRTLVAFFQQPGLKMDFLQKVQQQKICLETVSMTDPSVLAVTGYVRVQNITFHKSVYVRYSLNNWKTFSDLQAIYVPDSCDGFSDKFSFVLYGHTLQIGEKLEFALRLECCGNQYWDNNGDLNYVFNCLPGTSATSFFSSAYDPQVNPSFDFY